MSNKIQLKRSTVAGRIPTTSDLDIGEVAVNHADGKMYIARTTDGTVTSVAEISGASFTGDLAGNSLFDSVNKRIIGNAYPVSMPSGGITNSPIGQVTRTIDYSSGQLLPPPAGQYQTYGSLFSSNISLATGGAGGNRQSTASTTYAQVWAMNNMNSNDRIRALDGTLEINLNGMTWGDSSVAQRGRTSAIGTRGQAFIDGSGTMGQAVGLNGAVVQVPSGGGDQRINYATGNYGLILQLGGNSFTSGTMGLGRAFAGQVLGNSSVGTIDTAVIYHVPSDAFSGTITNKFSFLNDSSAPLLSFGSVKVPNGIFDGYPDATIAAPTLTYLATNKPTVNLGNVDISNNHNITLDGNLTVNSSGLPGYSPDYLSTMGNKYNFTITQSGGPFTITWDSKLNVIGDIAPTGTSYASIFVDADGTGSVAIQSSNIVGVSGTFSGDVNAADIYGKNITPVATKTANYTVSLTDEIIAANGAITVTLPSAATAGNGRSYQVKRISNAGPVMVNATAGTIDGNDAIEINAQWASITVVSDGSNWLII